MQDDEGPVKYPLYQPATSRKITAQVILKMKIGKEMGKATSIRKGTKINETKRDKLEFNWPGTNRVWLSKLMKLLIIVRFILIDYDNLRT